MYNVNDIRQHFLGLADVVPENDMLEIINASFIADEPSIFGTVNEEYCAKELVWYLSKSCNVNDIAEPVPQIWKTIANEKGEIFSNYGYLIFDNKNGNQYNQAINKLKFQHDTRQATMIYNRPSIHQEVKTSGIADFICTNTVQLFIRNNELIYIVNMRSNDVIYGYKNDKFWHDYIHNLALQDLREVYPNLKKGLMYWNANTLHIYPRHRHLVK
jgi:thymidylate synthase